MQYYLKQGTAGAAPKTKCSKKLIILTCIALAISFGFILRLLLNNDNMQS